MRSVVVVFPASICAPIPIFLPLLIGKAFSKILLRGLLPPVMGESPVRIRHLMCVFSLLNSPAAAFSSVQYFSGQLVDHGLTVSFPCRGEEPSDGEGLLPEGA